MPRVKIILKIDFRTDRKIYMKEPKRKMQKGIFSWRRLKVTSPLSSLPISNFDAPDQTRSAN
jgi:hypothetical protein